MILKKRRCCCDKSNYAGCNNIIVFNNVNSTSNLSSASQQSLIHDSVTDYDERCESNTGNKFKYCDIACDKTKCTEYYVPLSYYYRDEYVFRPVRKELLMKSYIKDNKDKNNSQYDNINNDTESSDHLVI